MTSTTQSNFDPALKQIYRESNLQKLTYTKRPLFGMLPKFEGFGGRNMPIVLQFGNPQGRSATFATAQSNRTQVRVEDFLLTRVNNYSVASIDGEVIESTRGDNYAFLAALKLKIDTAMAALADDIESELFRDGNGYIGVIGAITSSGTDGVITLSQIEEITNFEVGMTLLADDTITGASLRTDEATGLVIAVDRSAGTITVDEIYADGGNTDWAVSDYLFVSGDQATGAGTSNFKKIAGLDAWCPSAAPASTAFFGVDRTPDSRLYGLIHSGTADTLEDASIDAQSKAAREGGSPDVLLLHHAQVRRLNKELGAKKEYTETSATGASGTTAGVSYKGIMIHGDHGPINVVAANKCQANVGWMLEKSVWLLASLGSMTKILMEDDLRILRQATADGYEVRLGSRGNLGCKAPVYNVRIALPTP